MLLFGAMTGHSVQPPFPRNRRFNFKWHADNV
jgi:hypothetical protein